MTEKKKYYDEIRKQYPEMISKDQFYRIVHISKATALYLLQSGLVPCRDSGKKTRRYTIRTEDMIAYMMDRELHPEVYRAPKFWYKNRSGRRVYCGDDKEVLAELSRKEKDAFRRYIKNKMEYYGDLMSVAEVCEVLGYSSYTIQRWCKEKKIKAFCVSRKYLIPKCHFVDFLLSQQAFDMKRKSEKHTSMIKTFLYFYL